MQLNREGREAGRKESRLETGDASSEEWEAGFQQQYIHVGGQVQGACEGSVYYLAQIGCSLLFDINNWLLSACFTVHGGGDEGLS